MSIHPQVENVIDRIDRDLIGGAVDTAREVMEAMAKVAEDSEVDSIEGLYQDMESSAYALMKICPSFAPPINVLHMMMGSIEEDMAEDASLAEAKENLAKTKAKFDQFIENALGKIAEIGSELINDGDRVFMFSMTSTVWKVLRKAKEAGKDFTVLVTEARPENEGLWTVDEMFESNIPVEVSIDACLAELIASSDIAFAGVDAVGADGSVFNKSGTYLAALASREYGVPFYFVTDTLKFDTATLLGLPYRNVPVKTHEVLEDKTYEQGVKVTGGLFDRTPADLITAIITELGPIHPAACVNVMWEMKLSKRISELIPDWAYGRL
jgi:ribose 1,5-bisphosphate isomerase